MFYRSSLSLLSALGVGLALSGCGRSELGPPAVRIETVSADQAIIAPGADGVRVWATVINDSGDLLEVLGVDLGYEGAGEAAAFRDTLVSELVPVAAGGTLAIELLVDFPPDGEGAAVVDATVDVLNPETRTGWRIEGAERPLSFTYDPSGGPGPTTPPTLTVTTSGDELDGGEEITDISQAGGSADLSLREALTIVGNLAAARRIDFDPVVFDVAVAQPIALALGDLPLLAVGDVEIDGANASVLITDMRMTMQAPRVTLRNLALSGPTAPVLTVTNSDDLLIEDVDFSVLDNNYSPVLRISASDRVTLTRVYIAGSINSFLCTACAKLTAADGTYGWGFAIQDSSGSTITGSLFSVRQVRVDASTSLLFANNVIRDTQDIPALELNAGSDDAVVRDNAIENMRGSPTPAIEVSGAQRVKLSHNVLRGLNDVGISLVGGANAGIAAPVVTTATASTVSGTTAAPDGSVVEIFSGLDLDLDTWVADATVTGGSYSATGLTLDPGLTIRAIVTDPEGNSSEASVGVVIP